MRMQLGPSVSAISRIVPIAPPRGAMTSRTVAPGAARLMIASAWSIETDSRGFSWRGASPDIP
ncbi:hypothetical protein [Bradyrhizobium sp. JR3.5]